MKCKINVHKMQYKNRRHDSQEITADRVHFLHFMNPGSIHSITYPLALIPEFRASSKPKLPLSVDKNANKEAKTNGNQKQRIPRLKIKKNYISSFRIMVSKKITSL